MDLNIDVERSYSSFFNATTLLPLLLMSLARQKNSPNTANSFKDEYDYIIVGAGAAGSVVAARLSEIPCVSVLLLEAGPPPPKINDVPAYAGFFMNSDLNWNYSTVPQRYTGRGLINNQVSLPTGRGLGGGTILNAGLYVRGNRKSFDDWAAMGAKGWSYKEIFKYFIKLEDNKDPHYVANGYHGVGGPVTFMRPSYDPEIKGAIFRAAKKMGYRIVDPNARRQTGFYDLEVYLRDNQRCSTAKAYLVPAENRTNLDILARAMVEKVIIENQQAKGVRFSYQGKTYEVKARKEVIMSAGTINTAQLLMLSGVGPKAELEKHKITLHADLPVGQNLQDHVGGRVDFVLNPNIDPFMKKILDPKNIQLYINNRTGPLSSPEGTSNIAFLYNDEVNTKRDDPNYELLFYEVNVAPAGNIKPEVYQQVFQPYQFSTTFLCLSVAIQPRSRGKVFLQSANPYDAPLIDPDYLADRKDVDAIVEGMKTCKRIGTSPAMRKLGSRPFSTLYPGCEEFVNDDDLYFRCEIRSFILGIYHPVGTAKMGDPSDPSTVVDPELRVKNIRGLRVVDNSIMPKIVAGNTATAAIVIGEKASDMIKETIQCHRQKYNHGYYHISDDYDFKEDSDFVEIEDFHNLQHPSLVNLDDYDLKFRPSLFESKDYDGENTHSPFSFNGNNLNRKNNFLSEKHSSNAHDNYNEEREYLEIVRRINRNRRNKAYPKNIIRQRQKP